MYPDRELIRLAVRKTALRRRLAADRANCAASAAAAARPLAWLDEAVALWHRIAPFTAVAALPLGFLAQRVLFPRLKLLGTLVRWGPIVLGAARGLRSFFVARTGGPKTVAE